MASTGGASFCEHCGTGLGPGANFCSKCGKPTNSNQGVPHNIPPQHEGYQCPPNYPPGYPGFQYPPNMQNPWMTSQQPSNPPMWNPLMMQGGFLPRHTVPFQMLNQAGIYANQGVGQQPSILPPAAPTPIITELDGTQANQVSGSPSINQQFVSTGKQDHQEPQQVGEVKQKQKKNAGVEDQQLGKSVGKKQHLHGEQAQQQYMPEGSERGHGEQDQQQHEDAKDQQKLKDTPGIHQQQDEQGEDQESLLNKEQSEQNLKEQSKPSQPQSGPERQTNKPPEQSEKQDKQQDNSDKKQQSKQQEDNLDQQQPNFVFGQQGSIGGTQFGLENSLMQEGQGDSSGTETQSQGFQQGMDRETSGSGDGPPELDGSDDATPPVPLPSNGSGISQSQKCNKPADEAHNNDVKGASPSSNSQGDVVNSTNANQSYAAAASRGTTGNHDHNNRSEGKHSGSSQTDQTIAANKNTSSSNHDVNANKGGVPYNKRDIQEQEYDTGTQSFGEHKGYDNSHNSNVPSGLICAPAQQMYVHLHTIVPPEFNYNPNTDKVVVVMGTHPFGSWKYPCVELKWEGIPFPGYTKVGGVLPIQIAGVFATVIAYKYQIRRRTQSKEVILWEFIYAPIQQHHINRALQVPTDECFPENLWHQYDDAMQVTSSRNSGTSLLKSAVTSFLSSFGLVNNKSSNQQVSRLASDRQLAVYTYLPKWSGFVVSDSIEMKPIDAIALVEKVWSQTVQSKVIINCHGNITKWWPQGFSGHSLLIQYLTPKIDSFPHGSDDNIEAVNNRLISAIAITHIVSQFNLELPWQQWTNLFQGLRFPAHYQQAECNKILETVAETFKPISGEIIRSLEYIFRKFASDGNQECLTMLPLVHFLRKDCQPFLSLKPQAYGTEYMQPKWWGVENLGVDGGFWSDPNHSTNLNALWDSLSALFDVDPLLHRSFLWFQMTPWGLAEFANHYPPYILCCALHLVSRSLPLDEEGSQHFCDSMHQVTNQLSQINTEGGSEITLQDSIQLITVTSEITRIVLDKADVTRYQLLTHACRLLASSYKALASFHEPADSAQTADVDCQVAQSVLEKLLQWLADNLPGNLSMGGGKQYFPNELDVWNQLLSVELPDQILPIWKEQLIQALSARCKKVIDGPMVELFCTVYDSHKHTDVKQCLTDFAVCATDNILKEPKGKDIFNMILQRSGPKQCGELISTLLLKSWPANGDHDTVLHHLLSWAPFCNLAHVLADGHAKNQETLLSEAAQERLAIAKSAYADLCHSVVEGTILIGHLQLLLKPECHTRFIDLHMIDGVHKCEHASDEGGGKAVGASEVQALMERRKEELKAVETQWKLNACLLKMCKIVKPVDCRDLEQKLSNDLRELRLCNRCDAISIPQLLDTNSAPVDAVSFFKHNQDVLEMLQPLFHIHESHIFGDLWRKQADKLRQSEDQEIILSLHNVATLIWQPAIQQLQEISTKMYNATIPLRDVDFYFKDLHVTGDRGQEVLKKELTLMLELKQAVSPAVIDFRFNQVLKYYELQQNSALNRIILEIRDEYQLTGDFVEMEAVVAQGANYAQTKQLKQVDELQDGSEEHMETTMFKQCVDCLKPLLKCKDLITWINKEIQDERQLRVFVELAMSNAGEVAMEIDRVSFFHRAASGYAAFIFDLSEEDGYEELMEKAEKIVLELERDSKLPNLLMDTQKELPWLRQVKVSQGDVEMSSILQVRAIRARGVYTIGNIPPKKQSEKCTTLELNVPYDKQSDGPCKERIYTCDDLKDLQSKLTLVASKKEGIKDGQDHVDHFIEVFTQAHKLSLLYTDLCQAGCTLFSEWKALLYCGEDKYTVHVIFDALATGILTGKRNLTTELHCLLSFMDRCLQDWHAYVESKRSECYELNYFTTEQLVLLRHSLATFPNLALSGQTLSAQVLVLLSAVKGSCTETDVFNAMRAAAIDIRRPPDDEWVIAERAEAAEEARQTENKSKVIKKLMDDYALEESTALAAVEALGVGAPDADYVEWWIQHAEDLIQDESLQLSSFVDTDSSALEDDYKEVVDMAAFDFPSLDQTAQENRSSLVNTIAERKSHESLQDQLQQLWEDYLLSTKSTTMRNCLSLEHLGLILKHLAKSHDHQLNRSFSDHLEVGQPNLLVCPSADIWTTVLSLYMYQGGALPTPEEVLVCSKDTTLMEVVLLWRRALSDPLGRIFCLVRAELLDLDISVKAEQELAGLMCGKRDYHLYVVCSVEGENNSHLVAALDQYRHEVPTADPQFIRSYLKEQLSAQGSNEAACITRHKSRVEVIVSGRPGVGKSLCVQRYAEVLSPHQLVDDSTTCVTVPLFQSNIDRDGIVKALLCEQDTGNIAGPMIYHIDVSPLVHEGLDDLLFNLLILGGLCDSHGHVWRCKSQDLYLIEITDFELQRRIDRPASSKIDDVPFYSLLPCVTCHAPSDVQQATLYRHAPPRGWQPFDPRFDVTELSSDHIQRAFQYLQRYEQPREMERFRFDDRIQEYDEIPEYGEIPERDEIQEYGEIPEHDKIQEYGEIPERGEIQEYGEIQEHDKIQVYDKIQEYDEREVLVTLLKYCGLENPSWSELRHFACFLSHQLKDCQNSIYCNIADMQGFKGFVVKFLVKMARDFATPSLAMSEESPSRAIMQDDNEDDLRYPHEDDAEGEAQPTDLKTFQLRRTWETSHHPYIFFNHDGHSFTFMGVIIDEDGALIDRTSGQVIEEDVIEPGLKQILDLNVPSLNDDFDDLDRIAKLQTVCLVLGIDDIIDPDQTYELTADNVMKMLAIHMRFRCGIPVVLMGETGCGKTRLIRFLCQLQGGLEAREGNLNNMILMKVHGGTTSEAIYDKIQRAQLVAQFNKEQYGVDTVLFFDEVNTTESIGLIKEIMCDGRILGKGIDMAGGALKIVAACNPYRRHRDDMIERLKRAGLGYRVAAKDTQEKLGVIPLRELVYRVQPLPPSMLPLVWDFGQLDPEVEAKYIRQIVQRYVLLGRLNVNELQAKVITNVLFASQLFMREQKNECSFVSLRDVERCLEVFVWFYEHMYLLQPLLEGRTNQNNAPGVRTHDKQPAMEGEEEIEVYDDVTPSLILAIGVCYHAGLQEGRQDYRTHVAEAFTDPCFLPNGEAQILQEITRCQDVFLAEVQLDNNIARNSALKENVFMMVVCIELRIPLFLVGKPGSSKSLAKKIVEDVMQGESSRSPLFKHLKKVHMTSFQCSQLSTPDGILGTFRLGSKFQEGKDLDKFVSVVVLDEVGLAEDSPRMPLKTLHPLLETGSEDDEEEPDPCKKVAFIGLSNWALDPAKMNRGILVSREVPDQQELVETARGICSSDTNVQKLLEPMMPSFAEAYLTLCEGQDREYFGLRDFYSLIKMVYQFSKQTMKSPSWAQIVYSVRRNFGGLPSADDPVHEFEKHFPGLASLESFPDDPDCTPGALLKASLDGHAASHESESRYPLILTQNYAALPLIQHRLRQQNAITIFGSSFPFDQEYTQVCRNINRIKVCMETGRTVVLLNLENLYESLYDVLNQYYVYLTEQRYVDLGLGNHRIKCRVHPDFRLVVIADKDVVYKRFPTPLINRLEKHFLDTSTMLTQYQQEVLKQLEKWVQDFAAITSFQTQYKYRVTDAFVGYHGDTLASLVNHVCSDMGQDEGDDDWKEAVCDKVSALMMQCATPDAVMRLCASKLMRESELRFDQYFHQQEHGSLVAYLQKEQTKDDTMDIMVQVTTHSRLLVKRDINELNSALGISVYPIHLNNFQTEHQFCTRIREFYNKCQNSESLLLVQCEDGHRNNQLIACASYCIQDESIARHYPSHFVFVIQLSNGGQGFTSFQGSGVWESIHIDDLHPSQANRLDVSTLRGTDMLKLFEQDPDIQELLLADNVTDVNMEESSTDENQDDDDEDVASMDEGRDTVALFEELSIERPRGIHAMKAVEVESCMQTRTAATVNHDNQGSPSPIDINCLVLDALHTASARISDGEHTTERATERISILMKLMAMECQPELKTFRCIMKQRLYQLLKERETQRGGLATSWLSREALAMADKHTSGTFRKAIWQHLVATISPLLAELIAYCDCNYNLNLLMVNQPGHWQHQLWLAVLANPEVAPIHFKDFMSDSNQEIRGRALVKKMGTGVRPVQAQLAFSFLLKENLQAMYEQAVESKANSHESVEVIFSKLVHKSPWYPLLNQYVPTEAMYNYTKDFIGMVYKSRTNDENELECVSHTLDLSSKLLARQLDLQHDRGSITSSLVLLHLAHAHVKGRLSQFASLVEVCPDLLAKPERLMKQEGEVTLDANAFKIAVESLIPDNRSWKDSEYRIDWLQRIQSAKPMLQNIIQAVIHGDKEVYGQATLGIVTHARGSLEALCVLKLFVEHMCHPNSDSEEVLSQQAIMLWMFLKDSNGGVKTIKGITGVENVLSMCSKKASNTYFKSDINCPLCKENIHLDPIQLPCGHLCCQPCILRWFETNQQRVCPECKADVPEDYQLHAPMENREAFEKYKTFRESCNAFFMDVVSQLCFAGGTPPSSEVVQRLLTYVTKETEIDDSSQLLVTRRMTAFKDESIDSTPVIRSVILQLLLQSNLSDVQEYMAMFLDQSQRVLAGHHSPHNIMDVCMLFIQCLEDSFHRQGSDNPSVDRHSNRHETMIEKAIARLTAGRDWLDTKDPDEGLTVRFLTAIAEIRYGLVFTTRYLNEMGNMQYDKQIMEQVDILFKEAHETCMQQHEAHLFLVRHLCGCYGTSSLDEISRHGHFDWVRPTELDTRFDEIPDRYVTCGKPYGVIREAIAQAIASGQFDVISNALQKNQKHTSPSQRETFLLLALFREVTMSYGGDEDRQVHEEVMEQLETFMERSKAPHQREFAKHMIRNRLTNTACMQLFVQPEQGVFYQSILALVMHGFITMMCTPASDLLEPLQSLLFKPLAMQRSYLPTMPEDMRVEAQKAVKEQVKWYECPNGHLYTLNQCGRPVTSTKCKEPGCNADIGGRNYVLAEGNRPAEMIDQTVQGHTLGIPNARTGRAIPERHLSPMALSILRIILHSTMIGATVMQPQAIQQLIQLPGLPEDHVGLFLWQHLIKDLEQLATSCGKSQDDCLVIVHIVLQLIAAETGRGRSDGWDPSLSSKQSRAEWEEEFSRCYLRPVIENLDDQLDAANQALQEDDRFSTNPLMQVLYQKHVPSVTEALPQEAMRSLHTTPAVWQFRPPVTIESLQQYLERQHQVPGDDAVGAEANDPFGLLRRFLDKVPILSALHHVPDLIRLQQLLIDRYHRAIDAEEASKVSIRDFLADAPKEFPELIATFIAVWNQYRDTICRHGNIAVPPEYFHRVMDETSSLAMLLPTHKGEGLCSTAMVKLLIDTHNEFMVYYYDLTGDKPRCDPIQPCDVTISHLVTCDKDKELLPLVLAHKDYAMKAGQGTTHTFNLMGLQRQIKERFVHGRPKIVDKIAQLMFRQDSCDAAVFQMLRNNVPQKSLTPAIQQQILSQIKSISALSDCLAALHIAIGFLAPTSSPPNMRISEYLHKTLSLSDDRGIGHSPKANEYCRLRHILSLWQTLAVERASKLMENNHEQDPFDGVSQDFRHELNDGQITALVKVRRLIDMKQLVAELYEYIVLNLQQTREREQEISQWSIVDVLEAYQGDKNTDDQPIHGLQDHFPRDILLQNAVHTWRIIVDLTHQ